MYQVLIVDDDKALCKLIKESLVHEEIEADVSYSGIEALEKIKRNHYDSVILDVMMPGMDGFETLAKIRAISDVPVLMLTSKDSRSSKVSGLRSGADDYLTKPFDMEELIARIISLIRRYLRFQNRESEIAQLNYDGLSIDMNSRSVTSPKGVFNLPPKEFEVLVYLARNQGKILTKQMIYEAVWEEEYFFDDSNIMAIISRLRKKIEPEGKAPYYIQTVKGVGYRFNKEV